MQQTVKLLATLTQTDDGTREHAAATGAARDAAKRLSQRLRDNR